MKKLFGSIAILLSILLPLNALAVQITVPSAPAAGYILVSTTTGAYIASTTLNSLVVTNSTTTNATTTGAQYMGNAFIGTLTGLLFGTAGKVSSVATTTASCSGSTSCTAFTVIGPSPITISSSASGSGNVATSSAETSGQIPFWTSTAATPATLSGGIANFTFGSSNSQLSIPSNGWYSIGGALLGYASSTNQSTLFGLQAGGNNATTSATESDTTAIGYRALAALTTGRGNTAVGNEALLSDVTAPQNTALGYWALRLSAGSTGQNTALGYWALASSTTGSLNTAIGYRAGTLLTTGQKNVFVGDAAADSSAITGTQNIIIGDSSGPFLTSGSKNISIGAGSSDSLTTGLNNVFVGFQTGEAVTSGYDNIIIGETQNTGGGNLTTGGGNILFGYNPLAPTATSKLKLNIGNLLFGSLPATSSATTLQVPTSGTFGVSTSSPFAKLSVHANNGDTLTTLFAVSSSTPSATSTLFAINNTGNVGVATDTASYLFSVNGKIYSATGGFVFPDGTTQTTAATGGSTFGQSFEVDSSNYLAATTSNKYGISTAGQGTTYGFAINDTLFAYGSSTNQSLAVGPFAGQQGGSAVDASSTQLFNTFVGAWAGTGSSTLLTAANNNTAVGYRAFSDNQNAKIGGSDNTAIGSGALAIGGNNYTGNRNTALGSQAGQGFSTGSDNFALGYYSHRNSNANRDIAIGSQTCQDCANGADNIAVGYQAAGNSSVNVTGSQNLIFGSQSAWDATNLDNVVFLGHNAGIGGNGTLSSSFFYNATGTVAIGFRTGYNFASSSNYNTILGYQAGYNVTTGATNILIGSNQTTGNSNITTGSNNIIIGNDTQAQSATASNQLNIGNLLFGTGLSGTGAASVGKFGVSSSTPFSKLSVQALNGETNTSIFSVASSTQSATTTLFSVKNNGNIGVATDTPSFVFSVNGKIYSASGGYVFPDGTVQTTAATGGGTVTSISLGGGLDGPSPITTSGTITAQVSTSSVPTISNLAYWTGAGTPSSLGSVATSAPTFNNGLTTSGTAGAWVGGSAYTVGLANVNANSVLGVIGGSATTPTSLATSSLFTFPWSLANGGTNATSFTTANSVLGYDGTRLITAPLTTTLTLPYATSTSLTVTGNTFIGTLAGGLNVGTTTNLITGGITASSTILSFEYAPATSTSQTIDWSAGNSQRLKIGVSGVTVSFTNNKPGMKLTTTVCNPDAGTAGTITWPATVRWAGGTLPTQTTTAKNCDVWSFIDTMGTSTEVQLGAASTNF